MCDVAHVFVGEESARREAVRRLDVLAQRVNEREAVLYGELAYNEIDELWCVCVCVYMEMYIRAYIHTYMHTYIHAYIHTCIHTYIHTYVLIYRSTNIHIF